MSPEPAVYRIRSARPEDAEALVVLTRAVAAEPEGWLLAASGWGDVDAERRYLRTVRDSAAATVLVAADAGDRPVARISLARDPHPASSHVADLGILVEAGWRRRGIARALLARGVGWARQSGIRKLELHVFPWNLPAIALYESFGFEREGLRRAHYRRDGEYLDVILMAYDVRL